MEYKGLKAQYLFIFAGGLILDFVIFVILYPCGVPQWFCLAFGLSTASILVWLTFHLNAKYGRYGLMKLGASKYRPRYIINRRRDCNYLKRIYEMRQTLKAVTLETKLPLLAVEHGCIISKDADITVAFEVVCPELFTLTSQEYEAMHSVWCKAIKVLPHYSVVHKQDWFVSEKYPTGTAKGKSVIPGPLV